MTLYITAVDEPIYLVPYIRRVIESCGARVAGVAAIRTARPPSTAQVISLILLGLIVLAPAQWFQLAALRIREVAAAMGFGSTRHRLADVCRELSVPFSTISSVNDPQLVNDLKALQVDVLLNQSPEILRDAVLQAPRLAVINRHLSLLPAYRGAWPVFWQCAHHETTFGVTIHVVDQGLDTGDILAQAPLQRSPSESVPQLLNRLFDRSVPLTCEALAKLASGAPRIANAGPSASAYRTPRPAEVLRYLIGRPVGPHAS